MNYALISSYNEVVSIIIHYFKRYFKINLFEVKRMDSLSTNPKHSSEDRTSEQAELQTGRLHRLGFLGVSPKCQGW